MTDGDKKIIVDEDWKSQVEREKAASIDPNADTEPTNFGELPEATFEVLVSTLAAQAMAAMGHVVDPNTGKAMEIRLDLSLIHI